MTIIDFSYAMPQNSAGVSNVITMLEPELGSAFRDSVLSWVTDKQRPYKLEVWRIYVARDKKTGKDIGIFGFYRHEGDKPGRYWIGWLGVAKEFRRKGIGSMMIQVIERELLNFDVDELWAYTESCNFAAISLLQKNGMSICGRFLDTKLPQQAATEHSIALMKSIFR